MDNQNKSNAIKGYLNLIADIAAVPHSLLLGMFAKKKEQLKKMFSLFPKQQVATRWKYTHDDDDGDG